jgi:glycosyltransferase involved in cell wall biosynthesis
MTINSALTNTVVVIPCYNEQKTIAQVIKSIQAVGFENILVVNDGSTDQTKQILTNLAEHSSKLMVISNKVNKGQGYSTTVGLLKAAAKYKAKYFVTVDADGQHLPNDVVHLVKKLDLSGAKIAYGKRDFSKHIPLQKKLTNVLVKFIFSSLYGINNPDPASGLRAYTKEVIPQINFEDGHDYIVSANRLVKHYKKETVYVPITAVYSDYSMQKGLNLTKGFSLLIRMSLNRLHEVLSFHTLFAKLGLIKR